MGEYLCVTMSAQRSPLLDYVEFQWTFWLPYTCVILLNVIVSVMNPDAGIPIVLGSNSLDFWVPAGVILRSFIHLRSSNVPSINV